MNHDDFLEEVRRRTGGALEHGITRDVERVVRATLETLRERLDDSEAHAVADALPASLAQSLRGGRWTGDFDLAEFYSRVNARAGAEPGYATELAQVVCQVVAEAVPRDALTRLHRNLPPPWATLLAPRHTSIPPDHVLAARPSQPPRSTLSEGRPGSAHPLSEAVPDRAHRHSVVHEDNPHGDSKVSSAPGTTQEQTGDTLAAGRPGPKRPVSDGS